MESRYRTRTNPSLLLLNLKQLLMRKLSSFVVLFLTALKGMCAFAQAPANFTYYFQILCLAKGFSLYFLQTHLTFFRTQYPNFEYLYHLNSQIKVQDTPDKHI